MQSQKTKTETLKNVSPQNGRFVSSGAIIRIIIGILILFVVVHIGFYKTYIRHFPAFADYTTPAGRHFHFTWVMHFHGMMMIGWLLMLLVQPFLILKGKINWHRLVGKLSYVLAPLVLLSMYLITQGRFYNILEQTGKVAAVANLPVNVSNILFFPLLYFLAIFFRHRPALHMRFMCSTVFLMIGPAVIRALITYMELDRSSAFSTARIIIVLVAGAVFITDSLRTKRISPYALILSLVVIHAVLWELRYTPFWQTIGGAIANFF